MHKKNNGWYYADKGKHFILTEKGKTECASYRYKEVGAPVDEYDTEAVWWAVEKDYVVEVPIPDWVVKDGFRVVYKHKDCEISVGNCCVFPEKELAERYLRHYQQKRLYAEKQLYIQSALYEGRMLSDCREYEGRRVFNKDWYYGTAILQIGDLVEEEIVDDLMNCVPPACMRSDCSQVGEPASSRTLDDGKTYRSTFETFKKVADNTWEYCGDCFRGENVMRGSEY